MEPQKFCQSCNMPLDNSGLSGTEKDGSPSDEYCRYCYVNGAFVDPRITLDGMKTIVKTQMELRHIPSRIIDLTLTSLPTLKRWRN